MMILAFSGLHHSLNYGLTLNVPVQFVRSTNLNKFSYVFARRFVLDYSNSRFQLEVLLTNSATSSNAMQH